MIQSTHISPTSLQQYLHKGFVEILGIDEPTLDSKNPALGINAQYGKQFARGIGIRAGRAGFNYWLKDYFELEKWDESDFRFLATKKKITHGLVDICDWFAKVQNEEFSLQELDKEWIISVVSIGANEQQTDPVCDFFLGFIQEFTSWAGLGKFYRVEELRCRACDSSRCQFKVAKQPID